MEYSQDFISAASYELFNGQIDHLLVNDEKLRKSIIEFLNRNNTKKLTAEWNSYDDWLDWVFLEKNGFYARKENVGNDVDSGWAVVAASYCYNNQLKGIIPFKFGNYYVFEDLIPFKANVIQFVSEKLDTNSFNYSEFETWMIQTYRCTFIKTCYLGELYAGELFVKGISYKYAFFVKSSSFDEKEHIFMVLGKTTSFNAVKQCVQAQVDESLSEFESNTSNPKIKKLLKFFDIDSYTKRLISVHSHGLWLAVDGQEIQMEVIEGDNHYTYYCYKRN